MRLFRHGKDEAVKELRTALELNPNSGKIRKVLETVFKNTEVIQACRISYFPRMG
jgi:hypothetical protein